jgi:glutathione-specific gamma-glutamylcyclotransferase
MRLTPELVALVTHGGRAIEDLVPPPGTTLASEAEQTATIAEVLAQGPSDEVWIFAYGSLIWNTAFDSVEKRTGVVRGWHRSFCLGWDRWFRGHPERPGLMLSLDRGGQVKGIAYRLPPHAIEENMARLFQRELRFRPSPHGPRWVNVATAAGPLRAITFVIDRNGGRYVGGLSDEQVADALATASGHRGSMAEYLHNTVLHLEEVGLRDRHLWLLQEMVAERIEKAAKAGARRKAKTKAPARRRRPR